VAKWLKHLTANRKVAGSNPNMPYTSNSYKQKH